VQTPVAPVWHGAADALSTAPQGTEPGL